MSIRGHSVKFRFKFKVRSRFRSEILILSHSCEQIKMYEYFENEKTASKVDDSQCVDGFDSFPNSLWY